MRTRKERNREYYETHKEAEKKRSLEWYHANKEKTDKEKRKKYMAEYLKTYQRREKTPEEIEARNRKRRERYAQDPEYREREKAQAIANNKAHPERKRNGRLRAEFGITQQDYDAILLRQDGKCAICGATENHVNHPRKRKFLYVDHDHTTGKVRGLLCHNCNFGIGYFKDNPESLRQAAAYLDKSSSGAI